MLRKSEYRDMEKFKRTKREQQKRYYRKTQNAPNKNKRWTEEETAMEYAIYATVGLLSGLCFYYLARYQIQVRSIYDTEN